MKIAYLGTCEAHRSDGVSKKIADQCFEWERLGHNVHQFLILPANQSPNSSQVNEPNRKIYTIRKPKFVGMFATPRSLMKDINMFGPDLVYLRFEPFKPYHFAVLKNYPTVLEINSLDQTEAREGKTLYQRLRYHYNSQTRGILLSKSRGWCAVTQELAEKFDPKRFQKPFLVAPNSILFSPETPRKSHSSDKKQSALTFLFVGSPHQNWQGFDKLKILAHKWGSQANIISVGDESIRDSTLPNLEVHGYLTGDALLAVMQKADIALASLAGHRKGMSEGCALKVREYLRFGFPTVLGYLDTAFLNKPKPDWILEIPNCETNVEEFAEAILSFGQKMRDFCVPADVAEHYVGSRHLEAKRVEFLLSVFHKKGMLKPLTKVDELTIPS
jgi:hypothetical protein